ncbi:unnamed protein product [Mytilus coruscus]|uniref:Uncharacterized protein n=1 Tax=Mytilus coruscus TaxID=42192 RepID=A0A6J8DQP0_MYTCO|nr:unnamed protein product [Mytilus coruscus]
MDTGTRQTICIVTAWLLAIVELTFAGSWYNWGGWNECSKSCNGGLSNRRRMCYGGNCIGNDIQYRLCNTQKCPSDDIMPEYETCQSYSGSTEWIPRQKYQCSVSCVGKTKLIPDMISINLADGTKCSKHSSHYCINGKCLKLGCDGIVGSSKEVDDCGICDGDGTFCQERKPTQDKHVYQWDVQWTFCSVSCGTGFQTSRVSCWNIKYGQQVPEFYCDYKTQPTESKRECSSASCGPQWKTSLWQSCSVQCGGGVQRRKVTCVHMAGRYKTLEVPSYRCPDPIPPSERPCNIQFCPSNWQTGPWTKCSATCDVGVQGRPVYCMKTFVRGIKVNVSDSECFGLKPQNSRPCSQPPCFKMLSFSPHIKQDNSTFIQLKKSKTIRLKIGVKAILLSRQSVKIECPVDNFDTSLIFWTKNNRLISTSIFNRVYVTSKGALKIKRTDVSQDTGIYTCIAGMESGNVVIEFQSKKIARQEAKKIKKIMSNKSNNEILNIPQSDIIPGRGPQNIIALPSETKHSKDSAVYITSDWSKCSRTCGYGFQTRKVTCNIVTDKYIKIVADKQCHEEIPENHRVCTDNPYCPVWRDGEWSECSVKICKFDGIAVQTREIYCRVENNQSITLPPNKCDRKVRPQTHRQCINKECEAIWKTSKWTSCKPRCAKNGKKTRMLSCVWKHNKKQAKDNCKSKPKPLLRKVCRPKHCKRKCFDMSRYCSITKLLNMCRYRTFRDRCCATCTNSVLT